MGMIQTCKFKDGNGNVAHDRVEAAEAYLKTDWATLRRERWSSPSFDPEHPLITDQNPDWRSDPKIASDLGIYLELKDAVDEQMESIKSGPDDEYTRAENSLLMCQRVYLCLGNDSIMLSMKRLNTYPNFIPEHQTFKNV